MTAYNSPNGLRGTDHVEVPQLLTRWMGTLWTTFSEDPEFVRRYMQGRGMLAAQHTVLYQETAATSDRRVLAPFHRERCQPLIVTASARNTGKAAAVQLGDEYVPAIGPQRDAPFILGQKLKIGGYYGLQGTVTYPLPLGVEDVASAIVDNPADPTVVLIRGIDFYVRNNTVFFLHNTDPLTSGKFSIASTAQGNQALVWLVDSMVDLDYVYNFIGYVLGVKERSSEFYKRYLNALWDMHNQGATMAAFRVALAAILDEPVVENEYETVERVIRSGDVEQVITDKNVYALQVGSERRDAVRAGQVLRRGDFLTKTIKVFSNLDPERLAAGDEFGATIRTDVPALFLPAQFFASQLQYGLGMSWQRVPVQSAGTDANGNTKAWFSLFGTPEDTAMFWQDFWARCERDGLVPAEQFEPAYLRTNGLPTSQVPFEFFLRNFLKANTMIVTLDTAKLSATGRRGTSNLKLLNAVTPAHVYVAILEHEYTGPELYQEYTEVVLPIDAVIKRDATGTGQRTESRLRYTDHVSVRWIPVCA